MSGSKTKPDALARLAFGGFRPPSIDRLQFSSWSIPSPPFEEWGGGWREMCKIRTDIQGGGMFMIPPPPPFEGSQRGGVASPVGACRVARPR